MSDYTLYDFVKLDMQNVLEGAVAEFEEKYEELTKTPITLYPGDERRMLIASFMYICEIMAGMINYRANQNLIRTCDEETLELKGEERHVERRKPKSAKVTVEFGLEYPQEKEVEILAGKRVTPDGRLFFAVKDNTAIPAGETYTEAECEAVEAGSQYNGLAKGQIATLADNIPYITSVVNTTESKGGTELEDLEEYRERVMLAPFTYNTAGAYMAYRYWAMEADDAIIDAEPVEDSTDVAIYVLCEGGEIPTEEILKKVEEKLTKESIRPLTDHVFVRPAEAVEYAIDISYKIEEPDKNRAIEIDRSIRDAVQKYAETLRNNLGKNINPETLKKDIYNAGAASVTVIEPQYRALNRTQVARCNTEPAVTYAGIV